MTLTLVQCWRGLTQVPADWGGCAVTIGAFDGVHRGHQHVLGRVVARGRELGLPPVAVTFDPRPVEVLAPEKAPPVLTTIDTRVRLLGEAGAQAVLVLPFTREFSQLEPEEFIRVTLVEGLRAGAAVVGDDFRFGRRAAGDAALLATLGESHGFGVEIVPAVGTDEAAYSSSRARELIQEGDVAGAARILGRPHRVEGAVERGHGRGAEMGYPTANVAYPPDVVVPAEGVYAGWLCPDDGGGLSVPADGPDGRGARQARMPAAISIGTNPTFGDDAPRVEAYVLDRDDLALYGRRVAVEFAARLRDVRRFESADDLAAEMDRDVARTRKVVGQGEPEAPPAGAAGSPD